MSELRGSACPLPPPSSDQSTTAAAAERRSNLSSPHRSRSGADNSSRLVQQPSLSDQTAPPPPLTPPTRRTPHSTILTPDQDHHQQYPTDKRNITNHPTSRRSTILAVTASSTSSSNGVLSLRTTSDSALSAQTPNYSSSTIAKGHALQPASITLKHRPLPESSTSSHITSPRKDSSANHEHPPNSLPRRAFTAPIPSSRSSPSPVPALMAQFRNGVRPDAIPRNSSMDSAMSSVSSGTSVAPSILSQSNHSHQSSSETTIATSSDAASLVAQADGNPILALEKLLQEKKAISSKNAQLWSIVEKQRGMLHGLTADLERAYKDKERYRKRLKEYQEVIPAIPRTPAVAAEVREAQRGQSFQTGHGQLASLDSVASNIPPTSPRSPRGLSHQIIPSQDSQFSLVSEDSEASDQTRPTDPVKSSESPLRIVQPASPRQQQSSQQQQQHQSPLTPKAALPKQVSSPGEKSRKAAPAPLDLSQSIASAGYQPPQAQASASDYGDEDAPATIQVPEFERGRRRTREEDDREREIIAMAEEARSRSEKSKKSKGKQKAGEEVSEHELPSPTTASPADKKPAPVIPGPGLPSSPKAALPLNFPTASQGPADSIAAVLAPSEPAGATAPVAQTTVLPPKSPGLPMSPKPGDRPGNAPMPRAPVNGLASPGPLSPRQGLPLSPRAPKYPIPMPNTTTAATFPPVRTEPEPTDATSMAERIHTSGSLGKETSDSISRHDSASSGIYRGFTSDQYPGLILTPNALPLVTVRVWSSRLRPSVYSTRTGDEDSVFTLGIHLRSTGKQLWRVEKKPAALTPLDAALRQYVKLPTALPDRGIFTGHAPAKIDARRAALNRYFETIFDAPMDDKTALIVCDFFSKDAIEPEDGEIADEPKSPASPKLKVRKEGYLAKKGKQFGGWKSRYFILESSQLKHFESPGGAPLGIIKLQSAQIAKPKAEDMDEDAEFRHAFTVLEPKRKDSSSLVRHVLCAESDEERDGWVEALLQHIMGPQPMVGSPPSSPRIGRTGSSSKKHSMDEVSKRRQRTQESIDSQAARGLQSLNYNDTVALDAPQLTTPSINLAAAPSPLVDDHTLPPSSASNVHNISGPVAGGPIQNASMWGNKSLSPTRVKEKEAKKRSMFGFMNRGADEQHGLHSMRRGLSPRPPTQSERRSPAMAIFGVPLAVAAEYSQPVGINICLPSPVYRCIEYLEANDAANEEGIFRLSGSNTTIKSLKERFDTERDVNLLEGPYIDVHAVASLLKLYLRELPDTVLTKDKFIDFQKVLEVEDKSKRLAAINLLIHQLPEANREVLVALSRYLIKVVSNCDKTRMSLKNVGIVFAPTLNIPTPLVNMFITDFDSVFTAAPSDPDAASPVLETIAAFKAENPMAESPRLTDAHSVDLSTSSGPDGATSGPASGMRAMQYAQQRMPGQHSPKTSQNSFTEHLAEQRQQLRQVSSESRESGVSSAPTSARPVGLGMTSTSSVRRARQSPSPASRGYKPTTPSSRSTPPPNENYGSGISSAPATGSFMAASSASSSPSSFVSSVRGRDSPNIVNTANGNSNTAPAPPMSRKAKRESAMLGGFSLGAEPPDLAQRKSSYNRLRDLKGGDVLEEE